MFKSLTLTSSLFVLLILTCTYDKSGIPITLGGRMISISIYKVLFVILILWYLYDSLLHKQSSEDFFNYKLFLIICLSVLLQTFISFSGGFFIADSINFTSELYYIVQRLNFVFIPLLALRFKMPPKNLVFIFFIAIIIHYLFIAFQFINPGAYLYLFEQLKDVTRPDNALNYWDGISLAFIGLQRTSNYGVFTCIFGFLIFTFRSRSFLGYIYYYLITISMFFIILTGNSRASLIFLSATMFIAAFSTWCSFHKNNIYMLYLVLLLISILFYAFIFRNIEAFASIFRFVDIETEGSNAGKIAIIDYTIQLFYDSPLIGWGQQQFGYLSNLFGNTSTSTMYVHLYYLGILISMGLIGFIIYMATIILIGKSLWKKKEELYVAVFSLYFGLCVYNIFYDAGGLDVFGCFYGIASYCALYADPIEVQGNNSASSTDSNGNIIVISV